MGAVKSVFKATPAASDTTGLVTSGAGVFYGLSSVTTSQVGLNTYIAVYDASAGSSAVYDYNASGLPSAASRLLWLQQVRAIATAGGTLAAGATSPPPVGLHFFNGLVVGECTVDGTAVGASTHSALVTYRNGLPSNSVNS